MDIAQMFQRLVADAKHLKVRPEPVIMRVHEYETFNAVVSPDTSTIQLEETCGVVIGSH